MQDVFSERLLEIVKLLLTAGIGAVGAQVWLYFHGRRSQAKLLALRLAVQLEEYALSCRDRLYDLSNYHSSSGIIGTTSTRLPILGELPVDTEGWRSLSLEAAENVYKFAASIPRKQASINFLIEVGADEEFPTTCADLGIKANEIASNIRIHYDIKPLDDDVEEEIAEALASTKLGPQRKKRQQ